MLISELHFLILIDYLLKHLTYSVSLFLPVDDIVRHSFALFNTKHKISLDGKTGYHNDNVLLVIIR